MEAALVFECLDDDISRSAIVDCNYAFAWEVEDVFVGLGL